MASLPEDDDPTNYKLYMELNQINALKNDGKDHTNDNNKDKEKRENDAKSNVQNILNQNFGNKQLNFFLSSLREEALKDVIQKLKNLHPQLREEFRQELNEMPKKYEKIQQDPNAVDDYEDEVKILSRLNEYIDRGKKESTQDKYPKRHKIEERLRALIQRDEGFQILFAKWISEMDKMTDEQKRNIEDLLPNPQEIDEAIKKPLGATNTLLTMLTDAKDKLKAGSQSSGRFGKMTMNILQKALNAQNSENIRQRAREIMEKLDKMSPDSKILVTMLNKVEEKLQKVGNLNQTDTANQLTELETAITMVTTSTSSSQNNIKIPENIAKAMVTLSPPNQQSFMNSFQKMTQEELVQVGKKFEAKQKQAKRKGESSEVFFDLDDAVSEVELKKQNQNGSGQNKHGAHLPGNVATVYASLSNSDKDYLKNFVENFTQDELNEVERQYEAKRTEMNNNNDSMTDAEKNGNALNVAFQIVGNASSRGNRNGTSSGNRSSPRGNPSGTAPPPQVPKSKDGVEIPKSLQDIYNKSDAITQAFLTEEFQKLANFENRQIAMSQPTSVTPPDYVQDEHDKQLFHLMRSINKKIEDKNGNGSNRALSNINSDIPQNVAGVLLSAAKDVRENVLVRLKAMKKEDLHFIGAFYPIFLYSQKQKFPNIDDHTNSLDALGAIISATNTLKNNYTVGNTQQPSIVSQFFNQPLSGNFSGNQQPPGNQPPSGNLNQQPPGNPSSSGNPNQPPPAANPLAQNMPTQDELAPILKTFWDDVKGWFSRYINTSNAGIVPVVNDSPFEYLHTQISASPKYSSNIKNPNTPFVVKLGSTNNNNHHVFLRLLNWDTQDAQLTVFVNEIDTDVFDETKTNNVTIVMENYVKENESANLTLTMYDEPLGDILLDFIICIAREIKIDKLKVQDIRLFGKDYQIDTNTNLTTTTVEDVLVEKYPLLKQVAGQNFFSRLPGQFDNPGDAKNIQDSLNKTGLQVYPDTLLTVRESFASHIQKRNLDSLRFNKGVLVNDIQKISSINDKNAFMGFTIDTTLNAKCYENAGNNGPTKGGGRGRTPSARSVRRGRGRRGSGRSSAARQQRSHGTSDANPTGQPRTRKCRRGQRRAAPTA